MGFFLPHYSAAIHVVNKPGSGDGGSDGGGGTNDGTQESCVTFSTRCKAPTDAQATKMREAIFVKLEWHDPDCARVGNALIESLNASPSDFRVHDYDSINGQREWAAWLRPTEYIRVYDGLMAETDGFIAFVLLHEGYHRDQNHPPELWAEQAANSFANGCVDGQ